MKNWSDSRILVTGGAGFIGSAIVWALNQQGCEDIVVGDRLGTDEKWRNLTPLRFADYVEADDLRPRLNSGALGRFDCIFHLGACSATTERDASFLIHNNYEFTKDLAQWSLANGARFVYASSAATYGDGAHGMSDTSPIEPLRPLNMYGYSKHLFDLHAQRAGYLDRIVGVKYFNVFGPNENHKGDMRSLVHKATAQVQAEGVIRLFKSHRPEYGDGEQMRDFLYVKDAVAMTLHLAANAGAGGLFNLGSGSARTWLDLAGSGSRRIRRTGARAKYRVHRDAGGVAREVSVLHAGRSHETTWERLLRACYAVGGGCSRLRASLSPSRHAARGLTGSDVER